MDNQDTNNTQRLNLIKTNDKFSHYKLLKKLGSGGMGEVHLALDTILNREIALKFLSPEFSNNPEFKERFLREARSAAVINHPNIITIYEVSEFDDQTYIAMEYVSGISLQEFLENDNFDLEYSLDILIQICDGLSKAHESGLVHRDIKPQNILIDKNNRVRILDFGLAKLEGDKNLTQTGTVLGTVNYMSPEQAQGENIDYRSDIFSLGVMIYEIFTKKLPFEKGSVPATIYSIVHDQPKSLSEHDPNISYELQCIVDKALAKSTKDRYQNVLDIKNDIINYRYDVQLRATKIHKVKSDVEKSISSGIQSVAVLYLRNLGTEKDEYLSYGITEDLIIDLSRIGSIKVSPMRSILQFKESNASFDDIAEKLKVNTIIDGSILKTDLTIRISIQIINASTGDLIYSYRWEEPVNNLPQIKIALAEKIVESLNVTDTIYEAAQIKQSSALDATAYDYYLQGKYFFEQKKEKSDVDTAYELYKKALQSDSNLLSAKIGIAEINMYNGDFKSAKEGLEQALDEATKNNNKAEQVNILRLLSRYYLKLSDIEKALEFGEQALESAKEMKDLTGEAIILGILISIMQQKANFDKIIIYYDRIIEISRLQEDHDKIAEAIKNMGITQMRKGDYDKAVQLYDEAYELAGKQKNLSLQAACLSNKGNVNYFQGNFDNAFKLYNRSLDIANRIGDKALAARQNSNMALIKLNMSEFLEGIALLQNTIAIFKELGDRSNQAIMLVNLCQAKLTIGEVNEAVKIAEEALEIAQTVKHPLAQSDSLLHLGLAYIYLKETDKAIFYINKGLEISTEISNSRNQVISYIYLTRAYFNNNDFSNSEHFALKALAISKVIGDDANKALATIFLGAISVSNGLYNSGLKQIEDALKDLNSVKSKETIILAKSIYGQALLKFNKTEKDLKLGFEVMTEALKLAQENKIFIEAKEIKKVINHFKTDTSGIDQ